MIANRWIALCVLSIAMVLVLTTWFSATAIIPELTVTLDLSRSQATWLTNGVQAGFVLGALTSSLLSLTDLGRLNWLMAGAALCAALSNACLLLEPGAAAAILSRVATGVALALVYPPGMKFIATWFRAGRGLAMGTIVGALTLGSAMPHLVRALGLGLDWRAVIVASSLGCLLAAGIFGVVLKEGPYAYARTRLDPRQIGRVLRNRPVMLANFGYFGHMWELYAMWGWILAYSRAALEAGATAPPALASYVAFFVIALGAPGSVLAGLLADRLGRCVTSALCLAVSGSCAIAVGFVFDAPLWLLLPVLALWGFSVVADSAQFSAAVSELADQTLVGSALALQMGVGFLITMITVWLMPVLAEMLGGWRWSFLALAPGPALGILAMLSLRRRPEASRIADGAR